ncbi:ABC transporter permease [Candidatus Dependentiae bacterium]|nr:ABC transporter permease [Candidatus Dependentiae bacterium]
MITVMNKKWNRIWAMIYRNLLAERRNLLRIADFFYWPALDIIIWGFMGTWMESTSRYTTHVTLMLLAALVLWQVVMRASYEISVSLVEELWNRSLINLFATPLTMGEWIIAMMIIGIIKSTALLAFGAAVVYLFYGVNIFVLGPVLWMMLAILIIFGWTIGFMSGALIIYWGQRVQSLPWFLAFIFMPLSAVYFPLTVLPPWLQTICRLLPASYIFEQLRSYVATGLYDARALAIAALLAISYLIAVLAIYFRLFAASLRSGLSRLE